MTPREICILLLSGSLGVGGGVAVSQKTPATPKKAIHGSAPKKTEQGKKRSTPIAPATAVTCILEGTGPIDTGIQKEAGLNMIELDPFDDTYLAQLQNTGFGGESFPGSPPVIVVPDTNFPAVPEPAAWTMLISGFGLVGLSVRRKAPSPQ